jgi:hypothetical protein
MQTGKWFLARMGPDVSIQRTWRCEELPACSPGAAAPSLHDGGTFGPYLKNHKKVWILNNQRQGNNSPIRNQFQVFLRWYLKRMRLGKDVTALARALSVTGVGSNGTTGTPRPMCELFLEDVGWI